MLARLDFTRLRTIVAAAVLIGILAGLCGAIFASVVTEPRADDAIALEEQRAADEHADDSGGDEVAVDRSDQKGAGLFAAYALAGAFGLILAVTTLSLRTTTGGPFRRVALSGLILATAITVTPWLKYPPNPPAVGNPDTVGERERYYVLAIVLAALLLAGRPPVGACAGRLGRPPADRRGGAGGACGFRRDVRRCLPHPTRSPPANLVWQFRINSLTGNLLVWTLLTLGLGVLWSEARAAAQNSMPFKAEIPAS